MPKAAPPIPSEDTRERLLAAGAALFADHGFHGTSVRDIARRAGANVAAASYHFGSKEALYLAVLRTQFTEIRNLLDERAKPPADDELDTYSAEDLAGILAARLTAMLEFLLGPPPALHGALLIRELTDPSAALPTIVEEFIRPQIAEAGRVVARLGPSLGPSEVERCVFSIMGQAFFFRLTRPAQLLLGRRKEFPRGFARRIGEHVAEFSRGGIERLARGRGRTGHGR